MPTDPKSSALRVFADTESGEIEIDLGSLGATYFFGSDIVRHRLTGAIPPSPRFSQTNFVESVLIDVSADDIDFSECDFKDTLTKNGRFVGCKFDNSAFATTLFFACEFEACTFYNVAVHSSEFRKVKFFRCDLTNLLVKASKFVDCEFVECTTSNKVFEMSTLDDTSFRRTDIQVHTIAGNFGLVGSALEESRVRTARTTEEHAFLDAAGLAQLLERPELSAIEKLRIEYFLSQDLKGGSDYLDQSLDVSRWTRIYKNPGSFIELLESFSAFIVRLFERGETAAHTVLLLHDVTSRLVDTIPTGEDFHRVAVSLGGVHLVLSRLAEDFLLTLEQQVPLAVEPMVFLVNGPLDPAPYREEFDRWMGAEEMEISRLVEHNSPAEIELVPKTMSALTSFLALFLATRTKAELARIRLRGSRKVAVPATRESAPQGASAALAPPHTSPTHLSAAAFTTRSILRDLKLDISSRRAGRLRAVLVDRLAS